MCISTISFNSSVGRAQGWKLWGRWFESILEHINFNYKLYFKYIFFNITHFYLNHTQHGLKNISIVLPKNSCYFAVLHVRFSTVFFSSQLVDLFSYELPIVNSNAFIQKDNKISSHTALSNNSNSILVYNFHNLMFQERFFFLCRFT